VTPTQPMPICGTLLIVFTLLPWWPHAVQNAVDGKGQRFLFSCFGCGPLLTHEGVAASPEFKYVAAVLGGLPLMGTYLAGEIMGRNLLFGTTDSDLGDWAILIAIALNGAILAPVAVKVFDARTHEDADDTVPPKRASVWAYIVYASDMLSLVATVGTVGALWKRIRFVQWLVFGWFFCGFWPAIAAPPPMPTLRPAVPATGWQWFVHRILSSVLIVATVPPLAYVERLPLSERWVWPFAALVRTFIIFSMIPIGFVRHRHLVQAPVQVAPIVAPTAAMDWVIICACLIMVGDTTTRAVRLLLRQSEELAASEALSIKSDAEPGYGAVVREYGA